MISILHRSMKDKQLQELSDFKKGSWVVVEHPKKEELEAVAEMLSLETDLLSDALDPYEVPRIEREAGVTYVFTRIPYREQGNVVTRPVLVAVGDTFVLTVSHETLPFLEKFKKGNAPFYTTQKAKLFFQLFFEINIMYNRLLTAIRKEVQQVQQSIVEFSQLSNNDILRFVRFESTLNEFLTALVPTNEALNSLLSGKYIELYETDKDLIEDLFLANGQLIESCRTNLTNISNIRDGYSTVMTNNLNRVIKLLTALTILLTVPTMIASFYGMNVSVPGAGGSYTFWAILGVSFLISALIFLIFAKNRWF